MKLDPTYQTGLYYVNQNGILCKKGFFVVFEIIGVIALNPAHITLMCGKSISKIQLPK